MPLGNWIAFGGLLFTVVSALLAIAYKLGELSNRVTAHGARITKLEAGEDGDGAKRESLALQLKGIETEFRVELRHLGADVAKTGHLVEGLQRSLANLTSGRSRSIRNVPETDADNT